jgi:hypothetical protein
MHRYMLKSDMNDGSVNVCVETLLTYVDEPSQWTGRSSGVAEIHDHVAIFANSFDL